jgi:hypothetical protein
MYPVVKTQKIILSNHTIETLKLFCRLTKKSIYIHKDRIVFNDNFMETKKKTKKKDDDDYEFFRDEPDAKLLDMSDREYEV